MQMGSNNMSKQNLLLVDSSVDVTQITDIIAANGSNIITLDYESHQTLLQKNIEHEISDSYLTSDDLQTIQDTSYRMSKWSNHEQLKSLISYEGVNLGELFYIEFHYFLVPILKQIVEITKIANKHEGFTIICSPRLHAIAKYLTETQIIGNEEQQKEFLYDTIKVNSKILNIPITMKISTTQYNLLKKLSEKIINIIFSSNRLDKKKKSVLFVEFDTIRYEKIFSLVKNSSINLLFYGRRRPAIWNFKSFMIIKNSNCVIMTPHSLDYEINSNNIDVMTIKQNLVNLISQHENHLKTIFTIDNFPIWEIIKPNFIKLCEKRFLDAVNEINLAKRLFDKHQISSILLWSEIGFTEQIIIHLAKKAGIQVALLQHGLGFETPESHHIKIFAGGFPVNSDKYVVWGNALTDYSLRMGLAKERIETIGSPLHDDAFDKAKSNLINNGYVLLATSSPVQNMASDLTVEVLSKYENTIKQICQTIKKLDKKLVIKLHPFQDELEIKDLVIPIDPTIEIIKSGDILPLIRSCDIFLTIDISTTILEAQIFNKPVMSITVKDYDVGNPIVFSTNSCLRVNVENFEEGLTKILNDDDFKNTLVKNGRKFIDDYFVNQGTASEHLLLFLAKL